MSEALHELAAYIELKQPEAVQSATVAFGELTLEVAPAQLESLAGVRPDGVRSYVYSMPEAAKDGETLTQTLGALDAFGIPYLLRVQEPPSPKEAQQLIDSHEKLVGFIGQP